MSSVAHAAHLGLAAYYAIGAPAIVRNAAIQKRA
jgi:hypothetical protein